ncbi:hypothetical protein OIU78_028332 [Salix suchowensis]|nr:hypothetical protein OIU78_028332 [Salix suchowensis]
MKQQNSAKNLNKDGNESDQRHDEAYWIDGNSKGWHELRLKGLKSAVTFNEESKQKRNSEIECQPSCKFRFLGLNESVMPSSSLQLYGENADSLEANNAAF